MTDKEKRLIKDVLSIQKSILVHGITAIKMKKIESNLMKLGYTLEELEKGIYFF